MVATSFATAAQPPAPRQPARQGADRNAPPAADRKPAERADFAAIEPHVRELGDTVALLPWSYRNGKDAALQSAREVCNQLLLETGFNVFLIKTATGAMPPAMPSSGKHTVSPLAHLMDDTRQIAGRTIHGDPNAPYEMPTVEEMAAIGEKVQSRYVLAGRAEWSTRNVWVGIGNRAKSMCTVDLLILDRETRQLVLDARNIEGDSTENKNMFNAVTSVLSLNPLPLVLPGSVTPQEQRAVTVATAKALEPWLKKQRIRAALAQADLSAEEASPPAEKFSTLVSPVTDLQATLHVEDANERQLASIDPDMARLLALRTVSLAYKEPNRLRLSADAPQHGELRLVLDDDTRRLSTGGRGKGAEQDLANAPTRHLSLLDFCGVLTPGLFETMRARYVRQEQTGDVQAVVYDLTYWRGDDISYQRLWIDPATHMALKREMYDRSNKLKAVTLYRKPAKASSDIWLPSEVEIRNAQGSRICRYTLADARVDQPVDAGQFTPPAPH
jgi:outer membrane lipoprotein-sorting protein